MKRKTKKRYIYIHVDRNFDENNFLSFELRIKKCKQNAADSFIRIHTYICIYTLLFHLSEFQ